MKIPSQTYKTNLLISYICLGRNPELTDRLRHVLLLSSFFYKLKTDKEFNKLKVTSLLLHRPKWDVDVLVMRTTPILGVSLGIALSHLVMSSDSSTSPHTIPSIR